MILSFLPPCANPRLRKKKVASHRPDIAPIRNNRARCRDITPMGAPKGPSDTLFGARGSHGGATRQQPDYRASRGAFCAARGPSHHGREYERANERVIFVPWRSTRIRPFEIEIHPVRVPPCPPDSESLVGSVPPHLRHQSYWGRSYAMRQNQTCEILPYARGACMVVRRQIPPLPRPQIVIPRLPPSLVAM